MALLAAAPSGLEVERHFDRFSALYPGLRDPVAARRRLESMVAERRPSRPSPPRPRPDARPTPPRPSEPDSPLDAPAFDVLNRIEATLFRAFFVPEFGRTAWMCVHREGLFMTGAGLRLARTIKATFPDGPPSGAPAVWVGKLPDREATMMGDLNGGPIDLPLTEDDLVGAIERLNRLMAKRDLHRRRHGETTQEERQEILLRNRALNPDEKAVEPSDEDDPFA